VDRVTEGFVWPFRDPEWLTKVLIIGLIFLIPIVGPINGLGWMLATLDRLRAGEERMAPANLSHLERGLSLFVVQIGYALVLVVIVLAIYVPGVILAISQGKDSANAAVIGLSIFLSFLSLGISTLGSLAVTFLTPSFVLETDRRGIRGGFDLGAVYRRSRANLTNTLIAGLMLIASGFIGGVGAAVCYVGVVFTAAYALAVQAWILRCFEVGSQDAPQSRSSS
jgi:Protein of unknown function (DUF4013)